MSSAPSMPLFVDAYLADTTHLSAEEHGVYMLLLMAMWRRGGAIPNDDRDIARICSLSTAKWRKIKTRLAEFLDISEAEISQKRLKKEWDYVAEKREKNARNGSRGGRPRSNKNNDIAKANGSVSDNPNESEPNPIPNPNPKKEERKERAIAPSDYAFVGNVIRLKASDLGRWEETFWSIPDLKAELAKADAYYSENPVPNGKWFFQVSKWLEREHRKAAQAKVVATDWRKDPLYAGVL